MLYIIEFIDDDTGEIVTQIQTRATPQKIKRLYERFCSERPRSELRLKETKDLHIDFFLDWLEAEGIHWKILQADGTIFIE